MINNQQLHLSELFVWQAEKSPFQVFFEPLLGKCFDEQRYDRLVLAINYLFIIAFAMYSFFVWLNFSTQVVLTGEVLVAISRLVRRLFYVVTGIKLVTQRYSPLQGFLAVFLFLLFWMSCVVCANNLLFVSLLFMLGSQDVPLHRIALASSIVILIVCFFNALLVPLGYATDIIQIRADVLVCHSFGWTHRNGFAMGIVFLWCSWLGFRQDKVSIVEIILLGTSSIIFSYLSGSRTGGIALLLLFLVAMILKRYGSDTTTTMHQKASHFIGLIYLSVAVLCFSAAVYMLIYADLSNPIVACMNSFFSDRIAFARIYFKAGGITPWGIDVLQPGYRYAVSSYGLKTGVAILLDNAFGQMLIRYGAVVAISVFILTVHSAIYLIKKNSGLTLALLSCIALLYGITEFTPCIAALFPLYWILLGRALYLQDPTT